MIAMNNFTPIQITPEQVEYNLKDVATLPIYSNTKIPAVKHGYKSAIKNAPITLWLKCWLNIAISLPLSNLVCIDVDMHDKDGLSNFRELVKNLGEICSYTETTPTGGGLHIITSKEGLNENLKNCDLAEGVEFKVNGYVLCAPSYFNGKNYQVVNGVNTDNTYHFANLNNNWLDFINQKAKKVGEKHNKKQIKSSQDLIIINRIPKFDTIINRCRFLEFLFKHPEEIKEPVWFSAINMLTKNANSDEFIHYISQGHPNYTREETARKISESRASKIHRGCYFIAQNHYEYCKGCPKAEDIKGRINNER